MVLWMEQGLEPVSESKQADLAAIAAIKESSTVELEEKGNQFVKLGKKHYPDAIDCYIRALNHKALGDSEHSVLYANQAHVNLLPGNHRHALEDAQEAIKLSTITVKDTNIREALRKAKKSLKLSKCKDWYKILGVPKTVSIAEIKRAYKKLAFYWHPDKNVDNSEEAEAQFREIVAAYETDKASMLDEIITSAKFLQLQVKVLSMSRLGAARAVVPLITDI